MHFFSFPKRRSQGFSLVEIMVGIAIGMLGVIIITQVSSVFEGQKRTATTGSDAQVNGVSALFTLERDIRRAGYGMSPETLGCTVRRYYNGTEIANLSMAPVVIVNGANGLPDTVSILASSKTNWSLANRVTVDHSLAATSVFLNTTLGMAVGDLLVAYEEGKACTLLQASTISTSNVEVQHLDTQPWNRSTGFDVAYGVGALLLNMGSLISHTYSVDGNGNLIISEFNSATNTSTTRAVTADIVSMQAEYGFDTRAGVQAEPRVDTWSASMVNADGLGTTGDAGDVARIVAVRMAIVARSSLMEKANASGTCDITISADAGGRSANAPKWIGGAIDVSKNPDGSANANWQCYRYKTFENTIPLRNSLWGRA